MVMPMPYAQLESAVIRQLFSNVHQIAGETANKASIVAEIDKGYRMLHFTGHGAYNSRKPEDSALGLAGKDRLTAQEISRLDLRSYYLVSLAACETALTGNKTLNTEYMGIVSAFLQAGVTHIVSTLWNVEEISNAWFMIRLYELLHQGVSPALALKKSQHWLRTITNAQLVPWLLDLSNLSGLDRGSREYLHNYAFGLEEDSSKMNSNLPPYAHPYHWAAFTLTGRSSYEQR